MDRDSDTFGSPPEPVEKPLIDAAWAEFERLAAGHKPPGADGRAFAVPGYRLLREIHRGGQGVVYQALQESTGRKVAIKVLKEGPFADEAELARFNREADLLTRLNHPHIVAIHDRGTTGDGHAYYMMDYIPGRALDAHVSGEGLSTSEILVLFHKICEAVNAAHLRGIIHRDLKPSNIRIDEEGEPRILDFGLAKLAHDAEGSGTMTITGQFVGSLPWASPEQAEGRSDLLDVRTDVYSLGVILYQLVTRSFPYPVSGNMNEVVRNIMNASPARPTTITGGLDRDVEVILLKCLEKDAERRYQSAGELARDIQRHLKGEPIEARPASSFYQLRKFVRRNKAAFGAIAATFVILLTGVIVSTTLYVRAEHALVEKEEQRKLADERAKQTNEVADFQSRMLTEIDVDAMGGGIKRRMRDQVRVATERQWVGDLVDRRLRTPDEVSAELAAFDERLTAAQGADVARGVLDEFVLTRASHAVEQQFKNQPLVQARLSNAIGETYQALGLLDAAERALRSALEIRRRVLGNEHPDTLTSISNLGELLRVELKVVEASRLLREALETRRRVLGETHPDTLESIQRMGWLQTRNGLPQAEPYFRKALEHRRQVLGNEHPDTLDSINDMGWLLYQQGKYTEAEPYWREAMETRRRVLGDEHLQTLDTMANMGALLMEQGKLAEAEPYLLEALEKTRRTQGDEHQATVDSIRLLGFLRVDQNRFKEAEALFTEAMAIYRRTLPAEGSQLAAELNQLAVDFLTIMAFARAEALLRESLDIFDRLSQGGNPPPWPRDVTASRLGEAIVGRVKHELEELASKEASVSQLCEAETLLLEAWEEMKDLVSRPLGRKVENLERIVGLYETWDAAEPGKGYDAQAAEWRAKLDEFTSPAKSASP